MRVWLYPVLAVAVALLVAGALSLRNQPSQVQFNSSCITSVEPKTVRGQSMSGLLEPGDNISIMFGFYRCNEVQNGDIVAYNYGGSDVPIVKIIKAVPGDSFRLEKAQDGWNIIVNWEVVKNSKGQPYTLTQQGYSMLSLYVNDYKGIIPENSYLLLGNLPLGTVDSSYFGLVGRSDILGKVASPTASFK